MNQEPINVRIPGPRQTHVIIMGIAIGLAALFGLGAVLSLSVSLLMAARSGLVMVGLGIVALLFWAHTYRPQSFTHGRITAGTTLMIFAIILAIPIGDLGVLF